MVTKLNPQEIMAKYGLSNKRAKKVVEYFTEHLEELPYIDEYKVEKKRGSSFLNRHPHGHKYIKRVGTIIGYSPNFSVLYYYREAFDTAVDKKDGYYAEYIVTAKPFQARAKGHCYERSRIGVNVYRFKEDIGKKYRVTIEEVD